MTGLNTRSVRKSAFSKPPGSLTITATGGTPNPLLRWLTARFERRQ
jgi:hypothetical protein